MAITYDEAGYPDGSVDVAGGSGGYSTVQDEGVALPQRTTLNFTGAGVTAADLAGVTTVTVPGAGPAYSTVQDEGVPLPQRTAINFVGAGVTATDLAGVTTVTVPGGGGGQLPLTHKTPNDALFTSASPALAVSRNSHPLLQFAKATVDEVMFLCAVPVDFVGPNPSFIVDWVSENQVAGNVVWEWSIERNAPGGDDIDADSFAAAVLSTPSPANGTNGVITRSSTAIAGASLDGITPTDELRLKLRRKSDDGGDTMTNGAQVLGVLINWNPTV